MKEHIIPANPIPLDLTRDDDILVHFNSYEDKRDGSIIISHSTPDGTCTRTIPQYHYRITEKQLRLLENTIIKYRVVAPE